LLGNFDIVKLLLDSKADPNFGDSKSSLYATALGYAIDHPAIVKLLLDNNPALVSMPVDNQSWNRHELPVHFAVLEKKPETLKLLIQYGADPMASSLLGLAKPMFTSICKYHKIPREKYVCRVENMDPKIRDLGEIIDLLSNPSRLRQLADKSTDEKTPP
jgi:ankyrin repeat protein